MTNWDTFPVLEENNQARFLLDIASLAWKQQNKFNNIKSKVQSYLKLGYAVLDGDTCKLAQLIRFLEDPEMKEDFGSFFEQLKYDERAIASLDLASYACGFTSRIIAQKSGFKPLPDPVLECLPEIYEYFRDKAKILNL